MTFRGRSALVVGSGVAVAVLSAGAVAWACTPYDDGDKFATTPEAPPAVSQDRAPAPQPEPQPQPQPVTQPQPEPQAPAVAEVAPAPEPVTTPAPAASQPAVTPSRNTRTAPPATNRQPARSAATQPSPPAPVAAPVPAAAPAPALPSMGSVAGDLWSGFGAGPSTAVTGPGLASPDSAPSDSRGNEWAFGVGLLGAGVVALGAGTGAALVRRSRVPVGG